MTMAVSNKDVPWSAPVYFVYHGGGFYFFSNENSNHVKYGLDQKKVSVSVFHDSDSIDDIYGLQMSGWLEEIGIIDHAVVVKKYIEKFEFLKRIFGPQILANKNFFLEKFKSTLFAFKPEKIFFSDNSRNTGKRIEIKPAELNNDCNSDVYPNSR